MTIIHVAPEICNPNKFQPETRRQFTPDQLADLASIGEIGFIHTPIGYKENGTYMIIVGWRRRCAWMQYKPGELMPLDVRDKPATDQELYRLTVIENEGRENFNAIQKADLAAQAVELGMTQVQAGKLFNPPLGQAAVSHLLSLRKLPDEIKAHIASGAIPERIARQLVTPAKFMQQSAIKAAISIAKATSETKDQTARMEIGELYRLGARNLEYQYITPWTKDWPSTPIDVPDANSDKGEPSTVPTCVDCPFNVVWNKGNYCMNPTCHAVKMRLWQEKKKAQDASRPATTSRGVSNWERKEKERRKLLNADNKASRVLVAAAVPTIATALPDQPVVLDLLFKAVQMHMNMPMREADKKWKAAPSNVRREMIAKVLVTEYIGIDPWKRTTPAHAKQSIEKLAKSLKVKLPKSWADTATPKKRR